MNSTLNFKPRLSAVFLSVLALGLGSLFSAELAIAESKFVATGEHAPFIYRSGALGDGTAQGSESGQFAAVTTDPNNPTAARSSGPIYRIQVPYRYQAHGIALDLIAIGYMYNLAFLSFTDPLYDAVAVFDFYLRAHGQSSAGLENPTYSLQIPFNDSRVADVFAGMRPCHYGCSRVEAPNYHVIFSLEDEADKKIAFRLSQAMRDAGWELDVVFRVFINDEPRNVVYMFPGTAEGAPGFGAPEYALYTLASTFYQPRGNRALVTQMPAGLPAVIGIQSCEGEGCDEAKSDWSIKNLSPSAPSSP